MKRIVLLSVAIATLFSCSQESKNTANTTASQSEIAAISGTRLPIAILNVDTILNSYTLAQEANTKLIKSQENARLELNQKSRKLQQEMVDFQNKLENNAFLSRERAEQEHKRLLNEEQKLATLEQTMSEKLMLEQQNVTVQLRDSINAAIAYFNKDGRYHMVVSTNSMNDNVLYHSPEYDITDEILEILNSRYEAAE